MKKVFLVLLILLFPLNVHAVSINNTQSNVVVLENGNNIINIEKYKNVVESVLKKIDSKRMDIIKKRLIISIICYTIIISFLFIIYNKIRGIKRKKKVLKTIGKITILYLVLLIIYLYYECTL